VRSLNSVLLHASEPHRDPDRFASVSHGLAERTGETRKSPGRLADTSSPVWRLVPACSRRHSTITREHRLSSVLTSFTTTWRHVNIGLESRTTTPSALGRLASRFGSVNRADSQVRSTRPTLHRRVGDLCQRLRLTLKHTPWIASVKRVDVFHHNEALCEHGFALDCEDVRARDRAGCMERGQGEASVESGECAYYMRVRRARGHWAS
jgi:hypothetical protein